MFEREFERKKLMELVVGMEEDAKQMMKMSDALSFNALDCITEATKIRDMIDNIDEVDLLEKGTPAEKYMKAMNVVEEVLGSEFRNKLSFLAHEALYG